MTEVIDHPDACHPELFEPPDHRHFVVRNAEPSVVIVEVNRHAIGFRNLHDLPDALGFLLHPLLLRGRRCCEAARAHHPELRVDFLAFENLKDRAQHRILGIGRRPPPCDLYAMVFHGFEFGIERRDVLIPPVVDETLEAQFFQHQRPFCGTASFCIERHRTPCVKVIRREKLQRIRRGGWEWRWGCLLCPQRQSSQQCCNKEQAVVDDKWFH